MYQIDLKTVSGLAMVLVALMVAGPALSARTWTVGTAAQSKDSPVIIGGPVKEPRRTKTVVPNYPDGAEQGMVYLVLLVAPDGKVDSVVRVRRGLKGATEAAVAAARQWEYEPVLHEGKPAWFQIIVGLPNPWPR
jgi:hypothetical protein